MTVVFIYWGGENYPNVVDAIACAKAKSCLPVYVISDTVPNIDCNFESVSQFGKALKVREKLRGITTVAESLSRWFVLNEFAKTRENMFPVLCFDWDVLTFRNLEEAYRPFLGFDYTISIGDGGWSAAYGVNHKKCLDGFCSFVEGLVESGDPRSKNLNDMEAWAHYGRSNGSSIGNLFEIKNGSVFDHSMHVGSGIYEFDGPAKRVVFVDGSPHFVLLDGTFIAANTMHCWGSYKFKTGDVRKMAGVSL